MGTKDRSWRERRKAKEIARDRKKQNQQQTRSRKTAQGPTTRLDEAMEVIPGVVRSRRGRFVLQEDHRTQEERGRANQQLVESLPQLDSDIKDAVVRLTSWFSDGDSEEILGDLFLEIHGHNPETYKEYETKYLPLVVEWATWLYLLSPHPSPFGKVLQVEHYLECLDLLHQTLRKQELAHIIRSGQQLARTHDPTEAKKRELRFSTLLHSLNVRNPAYEQHTRGELNDLFSPFDAELSTLLLPPIREALETMDFVEALLNVRLTGTANIAAGLAQLWLDGSAEAVADYLGPVYTQIRTKLVESKRNVPASAAVISARG